jgi:hypothetical protein
MTRTINCHDGTFERVAVFRDTHSLPAFLRYQAELLVSSSSCTCADTIVPAHVASFSRIRLCEVKLMPKLRRQDEVFNLILCEVFKIE